MRSGVEDNAHQDTGSIEREPQRDQTICHGRQLLSRRAIRIAHQGKQEVLRANALMVQLLGLSAGLR